VVVAGAVVNCSVAGVAERAVGGRGCPTAFLSPSPPARIVGHTHEVHAVAYTHLPDYTPIAVTTPWDRALRVWDLTSHAQIASPLPLLGAATALAILGGPQDPIAVLGAAGVAAIKFSATSSEGRADFTPPGQQMNALITPVDTESS
jgi:WD40 repeat protein